MNIELDETQKMLQEMIREFTEKEVIPRARSLEESHEFPHELLEKLGELGILGMCVPSEYEGIKTDYLSLILAIEELSRALPSLAIIISVHCSLFCHSIFKFGTDQQKKKYLPGAAKGEILGAFSLTEPEAGSDATNLRTKAEKKGGIYILNGTKTWVTNGQNAGALILFAVTGEQEGKKRLSAFIVDTDLQGFQVTKVEEKLGLHASPTVEISLTDCKVPAQNLLGQEGQGTAIALQCLDGSRIGVAAQAVGLSQRALEEAVQYAKQREAFKQKIADIQAVQFMIADMALQLEASRLMTYHAASLWDQDKTVTMEAAMAKLFASEAANKVAYQALQIHGGYGYSKEFFVEQIYRDARVLSIYEGTSEIQRLVIARNLLKD